MPVVVCGHQPPKSSWEGARRRTPKRANICSWFSTRQPFCMQMDKTGCVFVSVCVRTCRQNLTVTRVQSRGANWILGLDKTDKLHCPWIPWERGSWRIWPGRLPNCFSEGYSQGLDFKGSLVIAKFFISRIFNKIETLASWIWLSSITQIGTKLPNH